MKEQDVIELLKGMQNPLEDYADIVCAPAFTHGYKYVYPEPEDYAIEEAINALKKQIPMKPSIEGDGCDNEGNMIYDTWLCPNCGAHHEIDYDDYNYCPICGQKVDLSDVN